MGEQADRVRRAVEAVQRRFPFEGYMQSTPDSAHNPYSNVANLVMRYAPAGGSVFDFGCGPAEKLAILTELGYKGYGYDDFSDPWHLIEGNLQKIFGFANDFNIDLRNAAFAPLDWGDVKFDVVMSHDVFEHLHDSPRELMNRLADMTKPGGHVIITVPNAVNVRKRLAVLRGQTNLPPFDVYYWNSGPWRGHVREYVRNDLDLLWQYSGLQKVELRGCDHMLERVPPKIRMLYLGFTNVFDGLKDSWTLVARKPENWRVPEDREVDRGHRSYADFR